MTARPDPLAVEDAIYQSEAIADVLVLIGAADEGMIIPLRALHWLGSRLGDAARTLRAFEEAARPDHRASAP